MTGRPEPEDDSGRLRVPPHSLEAEQSLLGGLLLDNGAWDRVGDIVNDTDFYRHEHRLIFEAVAALINATKPADVITVFERLQRVGKADEVGGMVYLNSLAASVPSAANCRRYAEIVRERSILRQLVAVGDEIATSAFNPHARTSADVLDAAQAAVLRIAEQGQQTDDDWEDVSVGAVRLIDYISAVHSGELKPDIIPTGFSALDEKLNGGPRPGEVVTIGMRSGMGKTALAIGVLMNAAKTGEPGGMFSMEMPRQQVLMRMNSSQSHIHLTKLKRPERLNDYDWSRLSEATHVVSQLPIFISDKTSLTINQIRSKARALKRKKGKLRVIVVDHVGLTRGTDPRAMRAYQIAEVTSGLKSLAKELGAVVYQLVQIKREADSRPDAMPTLADIRDASSVEDDSDIVIFGHREFKNRPDLDDDWRHYCEISIAKQRDGELGRLPLMYVGENTRFADWPADKDVPTTKTRKVHSSGGDL